MDAEQELADTFQKLYGWQLFKDDCQFSDGMGFVWLMCNYGVTGKYPSQIAKDTGFLEKWTRIAEMLDELDRLERKRANPEIKGYLPRIIKDMDDAESKARAELARHGLKLCPRIVSHESLVHYERAIHRKNFKGMRHYSHYKDPFRFDKEIF